jgi:hypothetical protein
VSVVTSLFGFRSDKPTHSLPLKLDILKIFAAFLLGLAGSQRRTAV